MTSQAAGLQTRDEAPDWRGLAACKDQATRDHDPWHPPDKQAAELYAEARKVCAGCPVRPNCLAYALDALEQTGEVYGMFAGLTLGELRQKAAELGRPTRKAAQHGTRSRYVRGCRCPRCTTANAEDKAHRTLLKQAAVAGSQKPRRRGGPWSYAS